MIRSYQSSTVEKINEKTFNTISEIKRHPEYHGNTRPEFLVPMCLLLVLTVGGAVAGLVYIRHQKR